MTLSELAGVCVNDVGVPILPGHDDQSGRSAFFKMFFETTVGQKFAPYVTHQAGSRIEQIIAKWFGGDDSEVTLPMLTQVVEALLRIKDPAVILPDEAEEPALDTRPRDSQGRFLSEFEVWANDPRRSMAEIRQRAGRDQDFGAWFRAQIAEQTTQAGEFNILGAPSRIATPTDQLLLAEFVKLYRATPTSQLRPRSGKITLDGSHSYTPQQFEDLITRASEAGLL